MSLFEEFKKSVTDFTENVAKKSSTVIETQKLKMQKSSLESDLRDCYVALGKLYEKALKGGCGEDSSEGRIMAKLSSIRSQAADIEESLRKMKGVVCCPSCGQSISKEFDFCPKCGASLGPAPACEPGGETQTDEEEQTADFETAAAPKDTVGGDIENIEDEEKDNEK